MTQPFDFDKVLKVLKDGQPLTGQEGILTPLIKQLTKAALAAKLDSHPAQDAQANLKNGYISKTMKTPSGRFELDTPHDRSGSFEPQRVKKTRPRFLMISSKKLFACSPQGSATRISVVKSVKCTL